MVYRSNMDTRYMLSALASNESDIPIKHIIVAGQKLEITPVFKAYWEFAAERQRIFVRRTQGSNSASTTDDPILQRYKFTNTYRASDRVSQYLIRNVIYTESGTNDLENFFFRILLFKLFNKIETWEALEDEFGHIDIDCFDIEDMDQFLTSRIERGERLYSAAYIMPSAGRSFGQHYKHSNHLRLIEHMLREDYPARLRRAPDMQTGYELLLGAPSIGPFLAYQFITDLNYAADLTFDEMEFVKAGPGALDGISKCFVNTRAICAEDIIRHFAENQDHYFDRLQIEFPGLWGRRLQLIDCQNVFCEISKYARVAFPEIPGVAGRSRIKQKFQSSGRTPLPWYPPKWGINGAIGSQRAPRRQIGAGSHTAKAEQYMLL